MISLPAIVEAVLAKMGHDSSITIPTNFLYAEILMYDLHIALYNFWFKNVNRVFLKELGASSVQKLILENFSFLLFFVHGSTFQVAEGDPRKIFYGSSVTQTLAG